MNKPKSAAKLPQGRVMRMHPWSLDPATRTPPTIFHQKVTAGGLRHEMPVLVLPMPTLAAAKKRLRFEKLSETEKVEAIAKAIYESERYRLFKNKKYSQAGYPQWPAWEKKGDFMRLEYRALCKDHARAILSLIQP